MRPVMLLLVTLLMFASCKKSYHCTCDNPSPPNASTRTFDIRADDEQEAINTCMQKAGETHASVCLLD